MQIASSAGTVYHDIHPNAQRVSRSNSTVQPEKVPNIIQSWHIKFDGSKDGLQTEEFLYRVKALAQQNLRGDRQLLCDHLLALVVYIPYSFSENASFGSFNILYLYLVFVFGSSVNAASNAKLFLILQFALGSK